jgi:hypothetical protein
MRYFTPELLERIASADDDVADAAHEEWEQAIVRSKRRWQKIQKAFPQAVGRFEEESVCLHDARVVSIARASDTVAMVLRAGPPAEDVVLLTFTRDGQPVIDPNALPGHGDGRVVTWLYEEWDLDRGGRCWFEVLLSNGWSIRCRFRDFTYLVLRPLLPARDGPVADGPPAAVPRSA